MDTDDRQPTPPAFDSAAFRRVLGCFPTGVVVLTAHHSSGPVGMAVNSIVSVSLQPPLLAVCPARSSTTWPLIREARRFCVNVIASHHESAARGFSARTGDRFAEHLIHERLGGPALDEAVAWIDCTLIDEHDGGDHTIAVGRVDALDASGVEISPLVFFRGRYGTFASGV